MFRQLFTFSFGLLTPTKWADTVAFLRILMPLARFSRKTMPDWQQNTAKMMQNRARSRTFSALLMPLAAFLALSLNQKGDPISLL